MVDLSRRNLLHAAAAASLLPGAAHAVEPDSATIGWPSDVTSWDPNLRFTPDAQAIFKAVFDQPLDQDPKLKLVPNLITKWEMAADARSLALEFRDDVTFHDGSKFTAADFRWTFIERTKAGQKLDVAQSMRKLTDIEVLSPTKAVMRFDSPAPTVPVWLAFLGSFVVPKAYMEKVGPEEFAKKPIGTGPYKLVEHQMNARIVLERNDAYWGPKPALKRITIEIIKDPSARVAAVQSGQVDITTAVPVREIARLGAMANLSAELNPVTKVILLQVRNDEGFADQNVRLACHHAIDKVALSKAFYGGAAVPVSVLGVPGSPGYLEDYTLPFNPDLSKQLLVKSGWSVDKPVKIRMATTNGQFPSDYDIARAIVAMWKKVGIEAELEVIEYAKYFELNRGGKLPEATLYTFDNATGDPEIYTGYLLNPKLPFSPWKDMTFGQKVIDQFNVADEKARVAGWRALNREAAEMGACMPLLQSIQTVVRKKALKVTTYGNGWVLPQAMSWG
ncbi:MAG TPA: ABC transporter substrate-binding protein [Stellaceae bacterium]|nr:ABC transporter substrate-binding protein [Stellaceae bacterium]